MGWLIGVAVGALIIALMVVVAASSGTVPIVASALVALLAVVIAYTAFYLVATAALATGVAGAPGVGPNPVVAPGELTARAATAGLTAVLNAAALFFILHAEPIAIASAFAAWAFVVTSLAAFPAVSVNRIYQGVLGWSGWIFPTALLLSLIGLVWFVANSIMAVATSSPIAYRIDFTTGAIETSGGVTFGVPGALAGSVGHFTFLIVPAGTAPVTAQTAFVPATPPAPGTLNVSAHETGHTLDYVAFGGFRVVLAIIDQLGLGRSIRAYTELTADSHVPNPGRFQVRLWT